jgi:hypothetical protein
MSLKPNEENIKYFYSNEAIARFNMIMAKEATAIMGRATGKTYGLHGERLWANQYEMPRCLIGLVSESYRKMFEYLLPPLMKFLGSKGMERDRHYFLRSAAPKKWDWPLPYNEVMDYGHFLHLPNGSGAIILSQDHNTTNNGASVDCYQIDEVRKLSKQKLAEDLPAMRGGAARFKTSPLYEGILYTTDMPDLDDEAWVLDNANHADHEQNELIFLHSEQMAYWFHKFIKTGSSEHERKYQYHRKEWLFFRRESAFYMEASSFENRFILGAPWFKTNVENNPDPTTVGPQIFTLKPQLGGNNFFPFLRKSIHTYTATNKSFLEGMEWNESTFKANSNWDEDLIPSKPLELTGDHNAGINCLVICQEDDEDSFEFRVQKNFYVKDVDLKRLKDACDDLSDYYKNYPNKDIYYYYDSTDIQSDKRDLGNTMEDVVKYLTDAGWNVIPIYTGIPSNHQDRYRFWKNYLAQQYSHLPTFKINIDNAEESYESMKRAKVKKRTGGKNLFGIDKSLESDTKYPQQYATHLPEAIAKIVMYKYADKADKKNSGIGSYS